MTNRYIRVLTYLSIMICSGVSSSVFAEWQVLANHEVSTGHETTIASSVNENGNTLEIYRDGVGAVRSRLTLRNGLLQFAKQNCPTYQIDKGPPRNRSINDASCLQDNRWAEFILGYIKNETIESSPLLAIMNGITITFRYRLIDGNYGETVFSLFGSKRAMMTAFGGNIAVVAGQ